MDSRVPAGCSGISGRFAAHRTGSVVLHDKRVELAYHGCDAVPVRVSLDFRLLL